MTRWLALCVVLLEGCVGSHPADRPVVTDCDTAFATGQHGDPCAFAGECARALDGGARRNAAVCDGGSLLLVRIDEVREEGPGPCLGERFEEADADLSFEALGPGCVEVTFCNERVGGGAARRIAEVCQIGAASAASPGAPIADCLLAVTSGTDGDPCAGSFTCIADREIGGGDVLPILGFCEAGILRLAPSQALIHGVP